MTPHWGLRVQLPLDSSRLPLGGHQDAWRPRNESRRSVGPWQTYRGASLPFQGRTPPAWHIPAIKRVIRKTESLRMGDLASSIQPWQEMWINYGPSFLGLPTFAAIHNGTRSMGFVQKSGMPQVAIVMVKTMLNHGMLEVYTPFSDQIHTLSILSFSAWLWWSIR